MPSPLTSLCLLLALAAPSLTHPSNDPIPLAAEARRSPTESLAGIDDQLRRGEWAAAEAGARTFLSDAMLRKPTGTFDAVARLAVAEAALGRTEDALWHWSAAQNLGVVFDPKPFGAPGELLASHPLRHLDEAPAGVTVRKAGDGSAPFSPPRIIDEKKVELPGMWGAIPRGMRFQLVVDAEGRVEQPVVALSTSKALTYALLKSVRDWRFAPAQAGEAPVAAFYDVQVPAERRPLVGVANFTGSPLAKPEATLRAGRYQEAAKQVGKAWDTSLEDTVPSRGFLGVALALKALAQAGEGQTDGAICRWQAAQTLEPRLYGADLSAYGAAGKLLEDHPWGEPLGPTRAILRGSGIQHPDVENHVKPKYPGDARTQHKKGTVVVASVITEKGAVRNLALLTPDSLPGMEASALDALCDWRFKPAVYQGQPVAVDYTLTTNFDIR